MLTPNAISIMARRHPRPWEYELGQPIYLFKQLNTIYLTVYVTWDSVLIQQYVNFCVYYLFILFVCMLATFARVSACMTDLRPNMYYQSLWNLWIRIVATMLSIVYGCRECLSYVWLSLCVYACLCVNLVDHLHVTFVSMYVCLLVYLVFYASKNACFSESLAVPLYAWLPARLSVFAYM